MAKKTKAVTKPAKSNKITLAIVQKSIDQMVTSLQAGSRDANVAALRAFEYAEVHNDATACQRLYEALALTGKINGPKRQGAFLRWLKAFSPVRLNDKTKNFGVIKKRNKDGTANKMYVPYDSDGAESISFLDFVPEKAPTTFNQDKLHKMFAKMLDKKLTEAIEGGTFEGTYDPAAFQTFANEFIANFTVPEAAAPVALDADGQPDF